MSEPTKILPSLTTPGKPVPRNPARVGKVHLVDDESFIVTLNVESLSELGYDVDGSTSALAVSQLLHRDPGAFDLLVTDLGMSELHGHELIKRLRAICPDLPVVVVTGNMPPEKERIADRYLEKPCTADRLSIAISEAFELRQ